MKHTKFAGYMDAKKLPIPLYKQSAIIDLFCLTNTDKIIGSAGSTLSQLVAKIERIEIKTPSIPKK